MFALDLRRVNGAPFATLTDPGTNLDVGKGLVADGILLFEKRRERKLAKMVRILRSTTNTHMLHMIENHDFCKIVGEIRVAGDGLW